MVRVTDVLNVLPPFCVLLVMVLLVVGYCDPRDASCRFLVSVSIYVKLKAWVV
jgi:hypothetical protein